MKILTYLREERIFDLQGLPKLLTVTAFQPESYLILPMKPKICNTEFLKTNDKTTSSNSRQQYDGIIIYAQLHLHTPVRIKA